MIGFMTNGNEKRVFDKDTLSFLEGVGSAHKKDRFDLEILGDAQKYNVEIGALEDLHENKNLSVISQADVSKLNENPAELPAFLRDMDVRLEDLILKIFKKSDRPFIIIYDDYIEYVNATFIKFLGLKNKTDVLKHKFFSFVNKDDWNMLAENIGEMLTTGKTVNINLRLGNNRFQKMNFEAIYLNNSQHFSFILIGERLINKGNLVSGLYDGVTGLPNFHLLEDRIQVAVNNENYKDQRLAKNRIALVGVGIDNYNDLVKAGIDGFVLKKLAQKLVMTMKKSYTIASGMKYHFWILMNDISSEESLKTEIKKIMAVFAEPVVDNYTEYNLVTSIGGSVFPDPATSAKKLMEQAILAIQRAQKEKENKVIIFGS